MSRVQRDVPPVKGKRQIRRRWRGMLRCHRLRAFLSPIGIQRPDSSECQGQARRPNGALDVVRLFRRTAPRQPGAVLSAQTERWRASASDTMGSALPRIGAPAHHADLGSLHGPAITEIESFHLRRERCLFGEGAQSCPRSVSIRFTRGNWVGIDVSVRWESGNRTGSRRRQVRGPGWPSFSVSLPLRPVTSGPVLGSERSRQWRIGR